MRTLLAYALLQSNVIHFNFAYLPKYQELSLLTLVFSASVYAIFVSKNISFHLIFWIALTSHSVAS